MVKTCEAEAHDAIPKTLIKVNIEKALALLKSAGYEEISDAGVMCVIKHDNLESSLYAGGRVLVKTADSQTAENEAKNIFNIIEDALS